MRWLAILLLIAGCGGTVTYPEPTGMTSLGFRSDGELAVGRMVCKQYPNKVLPALSVIYQIQTFMNPTGDTLLTVFSTSSEQVATLLPARSSILYADLRAVVQSLSSLAALSTPDYRRVSLNPGIRAFQAGDLAVSADCQAILAL